jgi:sugar lactone lactonase YvrE
MRSPHRIWLALASALLVLVGCGSDESAEPRFGQVAGSIGGPGHADGSGAQARFSAPAEAAVDRDGNVYIADSGNHVVRKISALGVVTTLAGAAGLSGSADGAGADARFNGPLGVAVDAAGMVYVSDTRNHTIRRITPAGAVSTLAGTPGQSGSDDGVAAAARFLSPQGLAVGGDGHVLVVDTGNYTLRKITPEGLVSTFVGAAGQAGNADGAGSAARLGACTPHPGFPPRCFGPAAVAASADGHFYVADAGNFTIRKVTAAGSVTTLPGSFSFCIPGDVVLPATCVGPTGVTADPAGNVVVAVATSRKLHRIDPTGVATELVGLYESTGYQPDVTLHVFGGVASDAAGNLYLPDPRNHTVRKLSGAGAPTTLAGAALFYGSTDGAGPQARFGDCAFAFRRSYDCEGAGALAAEPAGTLVVADRINHTIRRVAPTGEVSTIAGAARLIGSTGGPAALARFSYPTGVTTDSAGNVFVADSGNSTIRKISALGEVTVLAGANGVPGEADGTGALARFRVPTSVATDGQGTVYVIDAGNGTVRKVSPAGEVTTLAGLARTQGSVDGVGAAARFNFPAALIGHTGAPGIAVDTQGTVYVADTDNHTIRKITAAGVVSTLAGSAGISGNADGVGAAARLFRPLGVAVDGAGSVYVADSGNRSIRKIDAAGAVSTVIGGSQGGFAATPLHAGPRGLTLSARSLYMTLPNGVAVVSDVP